MLSVRNLSIAPGMVKGVTFDVRAGEIVGIAGVEGNGQRELIEALAGLVDPSSGLRRHDARRGVAHRT